MCMSMCCSMCCDIASRVRYANGHCADKIMSTYIQKYTGLNQIEERSIAGRRRPAWADTASTAHAHSTVSER